MERIEIDKNKELSPGDIIEMHFKTIGMVWLKAAQMAMIEWQLKNRKDFTILSWSIPESNTVIFTIRANKTNPVIVTGAIIGGLIITAGVVAWLTLDKVFQITETPAGKIFMSGAGAIATAAAIAIVIALLPGGKK